MDIQLIRDFCISKDPDLLKSLSFKTKQFALISSEYCINRQIGRQDLATIITNTLTQWEYTIVPSGTLLFRGTKEIPTENNRATYYAPIIQTANIYLPTGNPGYMNVYRVKRDVYLFKLDSLYNANRLLKETFSDKTIVKPSKKMSNGKYTKAYTLYDIVKHIYTGDYILEKETQAYQIKNLHRNSITYNDLLFSNWLCENNFNGYYADDMKQKLGFNFPAEVMICSPAKILHKVDSISMRKTKSDKVLQNIVDKYS